MKNIDIEKLQRKMPYELNESSLKEVENKVIEHFSPKKKKQTYFLYVKIFAAACLVLFAGLTYVFHIENSENVQENKKIAKSTNEVEKTQPKIEKVDIEEIPENKDIIDSEYIPYEEKSRISKVKTVEPKNNKKKTELNKNEEKIDFIIQSMSDEELSEMVAYYNNDVYLDIYNY